MASKNQALGILEISVNGVMLNIAPGSGTFDPGGFGRNRQEGESQTMFSRKRRGAKAKCEAFFTSETSLKAYGDMSDCTVVVRCDTGQVYTMANAFLEDGDGLEIKGGEGGKHELTFGSNPATETK